ncbi:monosaccharide ABC transporter substrate-binding protein, CUT2 family [Paramicrobacterium humi]|uniref:Monosaccharide ABC transporter substrate-binding protein, CUT2 family n=1 Tax=Paramicrobacterium humi TaxID=640635 RepID=A0A1H4LYG0_9MICO|nr:ABC transporter substrate-binding protein [Microbacterium humi]SEB75736.1 monosaccharide ABC transporter substrate-binding protein, CUT2 family [Microbacterium humi]
MNTAKKIFALAASAAVAITLAGCSSSSQGGGDEPSGDKPYIALVSKGFQHQFWQAVNKGAKEKADELGVDITFDGPASETEIDGQLQMLQAAIDKKPDAIGFAALDPEACIPLYDKAKAADIPIVEFDAGCDSDYGQNLAATDSKVAGGIAAEHMAEIIGGKGEIGIVGHSQINSTGVDRRDGFVEKIESDYPDIKIVDIQYGDGDHLKSADIAKAMINAHPNLKGLYGTNEGSAVGIVNAVTELGLTGKDITVVGFDSGKAQMDAIKNGVMAGAITQDPIGIGKAVVQAAYDAMNGKDLEDFTDTGSYWYDAKNIESDDIAPLLYE